MNRKQYGKRFPLRPIRRVTQIINVYSNNLDPMAVVRAIQEAKGRFRKPEGDS